MALPNGWLEKRETDCTEVNDVVPFYSRSLPEWLKIW